MSSLERFPNCKPREKLATWAAGAAVARFPDTEEVTGSIPVSPTTIWFGIPGPDAGSHHLDDYQLGLVPCRGDWRSGSALRSHRRGHWFEPSIAHPEPHPASLGVTYQDLQFQILDGNVPFRRTLFACNPIETFLDQTVD